MSGAIPFDAIQEGALSQASRLLPEWFPAGRIVRREFKIGNVAGDPGESLSINLDTGLAADFAGDFRGHDLIDVRAAQRHSGDRVAAAREIGAALGLMGAEASPTAENPAKADGNKAKPRIVTTYGYRDADGALLFEICRFEPKDFRQRRPDGRGGWVWNLQGAEPVLFRLPELNLASPDATVYVTEGEKDCDALRERLLIATTAPGGAGKWHSGFTEALRGRPVVILPDHDEAGDKHAQTVAAALHGTAASVRILRLPALPAKGDVSDWLAAGGTAEEMDALADAAPEWTPEAEKSNAALREFLAIENWTTRPIPPADQLLGDLVTTTTRTFLVGRTGLGKTLLALGLATGMASGRGFLHWRSSRPARVLVIDGEMPCELIRARAIDALRRADAPLPPGNLIIYARDAEEDFATRFPNLGAMPPLNSEAGQNWTLALIEALGGVDVVIFDNVMSLIGGDQKDEVSWSDTLPLVQSLTGKRVGQIWLDHTGHNTDRQYGSSTKAWRFDAVGVMAPLAEDLQEHGGVAFTVSFDHPGKARRRTPDNWRDFATTTIRLTDDRWASETTGQATAAVSARPMSLKYLAAFRDAMVVAPNGPAGTITRDEWQSELMRRALLPQPDPDKAAERRRQNGFGANVRRMIAEGLVATGDGGATFNDLNFGNRP